ncbi:hydantoinase/oxoprolinase family protein [Burkholderia sp. MR1-5-21]
MKDTAAYSLGIDIGGTFTDIVLYSNGLAKAFGHKELTTPDDPTQGAMRGVEVLLEREGVNASQITRVVHATTLFTNALIERRGVKTGLITTAGFRDTLEMRREFKYDLYDVFIDIPKPLVPRASRLEAMERVLADGTVDTPIDDASVLSSADELVRQGIESIAIVFLHAYANPEHERRARDLILQKYPDLYVSISSEVAPQIREYERTSTTVANAYVVPIAERYLQSLEARLKQNGIGCPLLMMLSNGGLAHVNEARRFPVQLLESGPAAGAIAAAFFSKRSNIADVLAFDMGGTTAKLAIVEANQPLVAHTFEAARQKRFANGSGMPINISTVELIEIGAGGGSIAHLDSLGLLKVGPRSASSKPGPACFGRGGNEPTVTDGNLLVGHLDPTTFAGRTMTLKRELAETAVANVAQGLGSEVIEVADGIVAVVNENMAAAARVHVAERGFDASAFALLVTGGGGPLHGCDVARRLGVNKIICPPLAGVASALGLLMAPARIDRSVSFNRPLSEVPPDVLERRFAELEQQASNVIRDTLPEGTSFTLQRAADIRFIGQGFELVVQVPSTKCDDSTAGIILDRFCEAYGNVFGQVPPVRSVELTTLRVAAIEENVNRPLSLGADTEAWIPSTSHRDLWVANQNKFVQAPVISRQALVPGKTVVGPALVEDASSTLAIPPGATAEIDAAGNLLINLALHGESYEMRETAQEVTSE